MKEPALSLSLLTPVSTDPLLELIAQVRADPRPDKLDLGIGVFRDQFDRTPVMAAVKAAEYILWSEQDTKSYLGAAGDLRFVALLTTLIFGSSQDSPPVVGLQTPGGTGALRLAAELLVDAGIERIHLGSPDWPNHRSIFERAGLEVISFQSFKPPEQSFDVNAVLGAIDRATPGDAILLQASCHNPTGSDPLEQDWQDIANALLRSKVVPLLDAAYHGLGGGLSQDMKGVRHLAGTQPYLLVAYSCDKNFGLYRERTGCLHMVVPDAERAAALLSNAIAAARANWSMPPDHGAAIVRIILDSPRLTDTWTTELEAMRQRLRQNCDHLAERVSTLGSGFGKLTDRQGMFCTLPLDRSEIEQIRVRHSVYLAPGGRINLAGLSEAGTERLMLVLAETVEERRRSTRQP